jgi:hypothetical protein
MFDASELSVMNETLAFVENAYKICCGWQYMFISFNMTHNKGMNF